MPLYSLLQACFKLMCLQSIRCLQLIKILEGYTSNGCRNLKKKEVIETLAQYGMSIVKPLPGLLNNCKESMGLWEWSYTVVKDTIKAYFG